MKLSYILLFVLPVLLLISCGDPQKSVLKSASPDGSKEIEISGSKATFADPWVLHFSVKDAQDGSAPVAEVYASELSDQTVKFDWSDNTTCTITFTQSDDTKRLFLLQVLENGMQLRDLSAE